MTSQPTTHTPTIPPTRPSVAAKAMRNELNRMANNVQDPEAKKIFSAEMEDFFILFNRYLTEKAKNETM